MSAPERIYLQWYGDADPDVEGDSDTSAEDVTWCAENIYEHDVEYVRADLATHPGTLTEAQMDAALAKFLEYFEANYPGPDTIISVPSWHAPRIFRAVVRAVLDARGAVLDARWAGGAPPAAPEFVEGVPPEDVTQAVAKLFETFNQLFGQRWAKKYEDPKYRELWARACVARGLTGADITARIERFADARWPPTFAEFASITMPGSNPPPAHDGAQRLEIGKVYVVVVRRHGTFEGRMVSINGVRAELATAEGMVSIHRNSATFTELRG